MSSSRRRAEVCCDARYPAEIGTCLTAPAFTSPPTLTQPTGVGAKRPTAADLSPLRPSWRPRGYVCNYRASVSFNRHIISSLIGWRGEGSSSNDPPEGLRGITTSKRPLVADVNLDRRGRARHEHLEGEEVFGPKKKTQGQPRPWASVTHALTSPSTPVGSNDTSDCVEMSEAALPSYRAHRQQGIAPASKSHVHFIQSRTRPVWGQRQDEDDTGELHGWGCTSCRPCTANIHA